MKKKESSAAPSSISSDLKELKSGPNETNATIRSHDSEACENTLQSSFAQPRVFPASVAKRVNTCKPSGVLASEGGNLLFFLT